MDMNIISKLVDTQVRAEADAAGQMKLGAFIAALEKAKPDAYIQFDWAGLHPGRMRSYRGYYDHLAIDPTSGIFHTVKEMLDHAKAVLGTTMEGYKGGDFLMDADTPLWVATWGDTGSTRVVGVQDEDWRVIIKTATDVD